VLDETGAPTPPWVTAILDRLDLARKGHVRRIAAAGSGLLGRSHASDVIVAIGLARQLPTVAGQVGGDAPLVPTK
jgi:hypothetical protein